MPLSWLRCCTVSVRRVLLLTLAVACPLLALLLALPWLAARLAARTGSYSIFEAIAEPFEEVVGLGEEVVQGAEAAFNAIIAVWNYLRAAGGLLAAAWNWVSNGVEWFASQAEQLTDETFRTLAWLATRAIPEAAEWVYRHAILWALRELERLWRRAVALVEHAVRWVERELHRLYELARHWIDRIYRWAQHAVFWVEHHAAYVLYLLTHPEKLAIMLAKHILLPIVQWLLRSGSKLVAYLLKHELSRSGELDTLIEDVLHDLL